MKGNVSQNNHSSLFPLRSNIAKECINRVCDASNNVECSSRRGYSSSGTKIGNMLGDRVTVSRASSNVQLTITSLCLRYGFLLVHMSVFLLVDL